MAAIKALCSRAVLMGGGSVVASGAVADVVDDYLLGAAQGSHSREWDDPADAPGNENIRLSYVRIISPDGKPVINIDSGAQIEIGFENLQNNTNLGFNVRVANSEGIVLFVSNYRLTSDADSRRGFYHTKGRIPGNLLNAARYSVDLIFGNHRRVLLHIDSVVSFDVENTATGVGSNMLRAPGVIRPLLSWSHTLHEESSLVEQPL
jgi:lipopolysaccharide transport system ATP-binding protein